MGGADSRERFLLSELVAGAKLVDNSSVVDFLLAFPLETEGATGIGAAKPGKDGAKAKG